MSDEEVAIELAKIEMSFSGCLKYGNVFDYYKEVLAKVKSIYLEDKISEISRLFSEYDKEGSYSEFSKNKLINNIRKVVKDGTK